MPARTALLSWYEPRRRAYPWRTKPTPYRVLVSEIMLQQTQAPRVESAFLAFVRRFPSLRTLAAAPRSEVIEAWSGLGYNRRAVALHEIAQIVVREHGGRIPRDLAELRAMPGIGPYTAAAIASLAYDRPVALVDTNVRRVLARADLGVDAADADPREIDRVADRWLDRRHPRDWNQALMDLGREVCRPKPDCDVCPLRRSCNFRASGAEPSPSSRRQAAFEGSFRQVRGAVVRALADGGPCAMSSLAGRCGYRGERLAAAVRALAADGLIEAGPAALAGSARGRVRLQR